MNGRSTYTQQLERLLSAFFEELQTLSDSDVLAGEAAAAVRDRARKRLERASIEAGLRRRVAAERALTARAGARVTALPSIAPSIARAYVINQTNNSRLTLAARKLDEMSDDDVLRLYQQIRELEAEESKQE
jgi:hypothetical protein